MAEPFVIPRMYSDASGECRFDSCEVPLTLQDAAPPAAPFYIADPVDGTRYIFFRIPPGWVGDLHPTPNPRLVICLSASLRFVGSKGAFCILRAGDRLLDVNATGGGHVTEVVSDAPVEGIIIRLD
jgi:hypothetical protein